VALPQNLLVSPATLSEDFEVLGDWTVAGGSAAANVAQVKTGTQSIKLTTNAGAQATMTRVINLPPGDWDRISFWVYVHDASTNYQRTDIHLSSVSNFAHYRLGGYHQANLQAGWNLVHIPKNQFSDQGRELE
jgi:hypothetical protein